MNKKIGVAIGIFLLLPLLIIFGFGLLFYMLFSSDNGTVGYGDLGDMLAYVDKIQSVAKENDVPPLYQMSIVAHESKGFWRATNENEDGSIDAGLNQINSVNWPAYELSDDPYDTSKNITAGVRIFGKAYEKYKNFEDALYAYNGGTPENGKKYNPDYAPSVLAKYESLTKQPFTVSIHDFTVNSITLTAAEIEYSTSVDDTEEVFVKTASNVQAEISKLPYPSQNLKIEKLIYHPKKPAQVTRIGFWDNWENWFGPDIESILILPESKTLQVGESYSFWGQVDYTDGTAESICDIGEWSVDNSNIATINGNTVTAIRPGTTRVTVSYDGFSTSAELTVEEAPVELTGITISPESSKILIGSSMSFTASAFYSDGSSKDITREATWQSSGSAASMSGSTATGNSEGTTNITASFEGMSASATLEVKTPKPIGAFNPAYLNVQIINAQNTVLFEQKVEPSSGDGGDFTSDAKIYQVSSPDLEFKTGDRLKVISPSGKTFELALGQDSGFIPPGKGSASGYYWPLPGYSLISSPFGPRIHPVTKVISNHTGIDIGVGGKHGVPIIAAKDGIVKTVNYNDPIYGYYVYLEHEDGIQTFYGHMETINVLQGQTVKAGDVIATVGTRGTSTGLHLHFGVKQNGEWVNPLNFVEIP